MIGMLDSSQWTNGAGDPYGPATDRAREIYGQLLALGNQVGDAYVDAYQKTAAGIAEFQGTVAKAHASSGAAPASTGSAPAWQPGISATDVGAPLSEARERALEIGEKLQEMNKKITLACLNACELAALAVADCQEKIAATSDLEIVKAMGGARLELTREVTKACVSAAREIVA
jgi:hypothetical protein